MIIYLRSNHQVNKLHRNNFILRVVCCHQDERC